MFMCSFTCQAQKLKKRERKFQSVSRFLSETEASISSRGCLDAPIINRADLNRGRVKLRYEFVTRGACARCGVTSCWANSYVGRPVLSRYISIILPCDFHSFMNIYAQSFHMVHRTIGLGLAKQKIHCLKNSCKSMFHFLVELYFRSVCWYSTPLTNTQHLGDL